MDVFQSEAIVRLYDLTLKLFSLLCSIEGDAQIRMHDKGEPPLSEDEGGGQLRSLLQRQRLCVEMPVAILHKLVQAGKIRTKFSLIIIVKQGSGRHHFW